MLLWGVQTFTWRLGDYRGLDGVEVKRDKRMSGGKRVSHSWRSTWLWKWGKSHRWVHRNKNELRWFTGHVLPLEDGLWMFSSWNVLRLVSFQGGDSTWPRPQVSLALPALARQVVCCGGVVGERSSLLDPRTSDMVTGTPPCSVRTSSVLLVSLSSQRFIKKKD